MLLNYVCKSVSAPDGTSPRTHVDTMPRPQALRGHSKTLTAKKFTHCPHPKSTLERSLPHSSPPHSTPSENLL